MRHLFVGLLVLFVVGALCPGAAYAQTTDTHDIEVHGVVLPARYIILDSSGNIEQILSNTTQEVEPQVYVGSITDTNRRPLSDNILNQYYSLLPHTSRDAGILYTAPKRTKTPDTVARHTGSNVLTALKLISILKLR